jgi:hypothetical protein
VTQSRTMSALTHLTMDRGLMTRVQLTFHFSNPENTGSRNTAGEGICVTQTLFRQAFHGPLIACFQRLECVVPRFGSGGPGRYYRSARRTQRAVFLPLAAQLQTGSAELPRYFDGTSSINSTSICNSKGPRKNKLCT